MRPNDEGALILRLSRAEKREGSWAAAEWLRQWSKLPSVACCQLTPIRGEDGAVLRLSGGLVATFGGLRRCSSPWSCPTCASRIGAVRTDAISAAVQAWHQRGHSCAMATLTMSHLRGHRLEDLWDAKGAAWTSVRDSGRLKRPAKGSPIAAARVAGYIVKTEVTHGAKGWHVHLHVLVFFRVGQDRLTDALQAWGDAAWPLWERTLTARGFKPVRNSGGYHATKIRPGWEAADVATYVAKDGSPMEALAAAKELALDTGKSGRGENVNQWGLLARAMEGDPSAMELWTTWETRSKGRRAIVWTRKLQAELLDLVDVTDEEAAADRDEGVALLGVHEWAWKQLRRDGRPPALLAAAEDGYRTARWEHKLSHFASLRAAQHAAADLLSDLGVPDTHVLLMRLPEPAPAAVLPDVETPRSGSHHHQESLTL